MEEYDKRVFARNLNSYMKLAQKRQSDICALLNVSKSTVSSWCSAQKIPRMDKIEILANYFKILKSDLIEEKVALPLPADVFEYTPAHRIPVLGRVAAGLPIYAEENIEGYLWTDLNHGGEYFGLVVCGDSMNAAQINDGNIIIVRKQDEVEENDIAVVLVDGEEATVKRFRRERNIVMLIPQSTNPAHATQFYDLKDTQINIIGKVVENRIVY